MAEFFDFDSHPGNLYVIATLLPLASFLVLLLAGAVRAFLRSQRATGGLYQLLGGDNPRRGAAYVATGLAPRLSLDFATRARRSPSLPDEREER